MAFTPEDGTGLATANAYMTEQEYRDFMADRGVDVTVQTQQEVEQAIVQATDYIDKRFGQRFRGWKQNSVQALQWPRLDAYDDASYALTDVPNLLKKGCGEYAWLQTQLMRNLAPIPGLPYPIVDPTTGEVTSEGGGALKSKKEKVDVIEESVEFMNANAPMKSSGNILVTNVPEYPQADMWLEELLKSERWVVRG